MRPEYSAVNKVLLVSMLLKISRKLWLDTLMQIFNSVWKFVKYCQAQREVKISNSGDGAFYLMTRMGGGERFQTKGNRRIQGIILQRWSITRPFASKIRFEVDPQQDTNLTKHFRSHTIRIEVEVFLNSTPKQTWFQLVRTKNPIRTWFTTKKTQSESASMQDFGSSPSLAM